MSLRSDILMPDSIFKALSDASRLRILLLLIEVEEICVCELTQALDIDQPKASRHLAYLRKLGVLSDRRNGKWVFYSLKSNLPPWVVQTIKVCLASNGSFIEEAMNKLNAMGNRPERQSTCCA